MSFEPENVPRKAFVIGDEHESRDACRIVEQLVACR